MINPEPKFQSLCRLGLGDSTLKARPFPGSGLGPRESVKGKGWEHSTGGALPRAPTRATQASASPEGSGQKCSLANLKFVFLESEAEVNWKKEDPGSGRLERRGEAWFLLDFPKSGLCLLSAKQKKHL